MISKNKTRFIISLQKKKVREEEGLFIIEGDKLVKEFLLAKIPVKALIAKTEFIDTLTAEMKGCINEIEEATHEELKHISTLKTPHNVLAVVAVPERKIDTGKLLDNLCVALDFVQDPGNLGTIIRAAAWFGIKNIVCSPDCVDLYNPKVIQASMGAILHVNVEEIIVKDRDHVLEIESGPVVSGCGGHIRNEYGFFMRSVVENQKPEGGRAH